MRLVKKAVANNKPRQSMSRARVAVAVAIKSSMHSMHSILVERFC